MVQVLLWQVGSILLSEPDFHYAGLLALLTFWRDETAEARSLPELRCNYSQARGPWLCTKVPCGKSGPTSCKIMLAV